MKKLAVLFATWFYSGLIPPIILKGMAGTYGSLAAIPLCILMVQKVAPTPIGGFMYFVICANTLAWGMNAVRIAEVELGPRTDWKGKTKVRDQNQIVIDEVLGMQITCIPLLFITYYTWWVYLVAFGWFRLFDIKKIPPTKFFDRQHTPFGVMMDDVIAGVYAATCMWATIAICNLFFNL